MKKQPVSFSLGAVALFISPALATPVWYDSFNYIEPGTVLSAAGAPAWGLLLAGSVDPKIAANSLSYPGLQTDTGDNSIAFDGNIQPVGQPALGASGRDLGAVYNIGNSPTLYYSLTFQVSNINAAGDWGGAAGNWTNGSFMMGFNQKLSSGGTVATTDTGAPLLIRTGNPGGTGLAADGFQQYQLGTGVTAANAARTFYTGQNYNPGDTLFLVLSYTFGSASGDDVARLFVNPIPGSLENANIPVITTVVGAADVTNSQVQSFYLRNNTVEPASTIIDNLRIGTTWEDVTPELPPDIIDVVTGGGNITFTLKGVTGSTYLIEKSVSLDPPESWLPDGEEVLAAPTQTVTRPLDAGVARLFYRARKAPGD